MVLSRLRVSGRMEESGRWRATSDLLSVCGDGCRKKAFLKQDEGRRAFNGE
jgi:hypothetical protein